MPLKPSVITLQNSLHCIKFPKINKQVYHYWHNSIYSSVSPEEQKMSSVCRWTIAVVRCVIFFTNFVDKTARGNTFNQSLVCWEGLSYLCNCMSWLSSQESQLDMDSCLTDSICTNFIADHLILLYWLYFRCLCLVLIGEPNTHIARFRVN